MIAPVQCKHCRSVYDKADGHPISRYADCTVFKTPCCGRTVDDRPGTQDFTSVSTGRRGKKPIVRASL